MTGALQPVHRTMVNQQAALPAGRLMYRQQDAPVRFLSPDQHASRALKEQPPIPVSELIRRVETLMGDDRYPPLYRLRLLRVPPSAGDRGQP